MAKPARSYYQRPVEEVAWDLLGCVVVRRSCDAKLSGSIVEVEAYGGSDDPGSHAFRGPTQRNAVMFGPPGHVYVYRIYHFHTCMNVVCGESGAASAVLIRALQPLTGIDIMARNRGGRPISELCDGPAKLCQALDITMDLNGADLDSDQLWIERGETPSEVAITARVGLNRGADLPRRYFIPGNPFVSRGKPSS